MADTEERQMFVPMDVVTPYDEEIRLKLLEAELADVTNNDARLVELELEIMTIKHYRDIYIKLYNEKLKEG